LGVEKNDLALLNQPNSWKTLNGWNLGLGPYAFNSCTLR